MMNELKYLLDSAEDLTIKIRFAMDHVEKGMAAGQDVDRWERKIKEWEKELDHLNDKILSLWKQDLR